MVDRRPEDRLGLDVVYIQAKRWDLTIGEFKNSQEHCKGNELDKVFFTTSSFSRAYDFGVLAR